MLHVFGNNFILIKFDDVIGFGLNLLYFEKMQALHFMLKLFNLKIVIGSVKEANL